MAVLHKFINISVKDRFIGSMWAQAANKVENITFEFEIFISNIYCESILKYLKSKTSLNATNIYMKNHIPGHDLTLPLTITLQPARYLLTLAVRLFSSNVVGS